MDGFYSYAALAWDKFHEHGFLFFGLFSSLLLLSQAHAC